MGASSAGVRARWTLCPLEPLQDRFLPYPAQRCPEPLAWGLFLHLQSQQWNHFLFLMSWLSHPLLIMWDQRTHLELLTVVPPAKSLSLASDDTSHSIKEMQTVLETVWNSSSHSWPLHQPCLPGDRRECGRSAFQLVLPCTPKAEEDKCQEKRWVSD